VAVLAPVLLPLPLQQGSSSSSGSSSFTASLCSNAAALLRRLFPFERGLTHALWAPNAWALYLLGDKLLAAGLRRAGLSSSVSSASFPSASATAVAGATDMHGQLLLLPAITPLTCALLSLLAMAPVLALVLLWDSSRGSRGSKGSKGKQASALPFASCATFCSLAAFFFGWHVHEKAILAAVIPALVLAAAASAEPASTSSSSAAAAGRASSVAAWAAAVLPGTLSLFPLIFTPLEQPFLLLYTAAYAALSWALLFPRASSAAGGAGWWEPGSAWVLRSAALAAAACLGCWLLLLLQPLLLPAVPFLPYALLAACCAVALGGWLLHLGSSLCSAAKA
jgi:alpha-1,3-glucosyltransferase